VRTRLVVLAKSPAPGQVKTRLTPPLSPDQAATLARASLEDTLQAVLDAGGRMPPLLALAGEPGPWLPRGFEVIPQDDGGLDERIAAALSGALGPALLIGMDTPQVRPGLLRAAMRRLERPGVDAVLGMAADGGWWALGMRGPDPGAVLGIPMSTAWTGWAQRERLAGLGLRTWELPVIRDVDTFDDVLAVARLAPGGRFARVLSEIARPEAPGAVLRSDDGHVVVLPVRRWMDEPGPEERVLLSRVVPPVLDIGCGPGRHVASLLRQGIPAMGIDPAPSAVRLARSRGATVLQRSVFDPLPRPGGWGTALLLDGNVGIGGDPGRLLRRVAALLRPAGGVLVEVEPPGVGVRRTLARVETRDGPGPWFEWGRVGAGALPRLARESGLMVQELWEGAGRWFARLARDRSFGAVSA
jgi:glycosyltransferase A (GT-A) superfamily protein (DUF2064 family)